MKQSKIFIYGKHAVGEALKERPEALSRVYLSPNFNDEKIISLIKRRGTPVDELKSGNTDIGKESVHQGVVAQISLSKIIIPYKDFANSLKATSDTALVVLGEIEDPHNVGAIIRSAAAFGIAGVLIPEHRQAPLNATVIKVSAGMAFRVPIVNLGNVNQALEDLKKRGFWIYGLAGDGDTNVNNEKFDAPTVFVLGNEGRGVREKTQDLCDKVLSIRMHPRSESLNVAASAAVVFYEWSRGRKMLSI